MAFGDFKDLAKRIAADGFLRDNAFNMAKNPKYDGYQRGLASMVYKFFDKKTAGSGIKSIPQKDLDFYYVLLIFPANILGLFR